MHSDEKELNCAGCGCTFQGTTNPSTNDSNAPKCPECLTKAQQAQPNQPSQETRPSSTAQPTKEVSRDPRRNSSQSSSSQGPNQYYERPRYSGGSYGSQQRDYREQRDYRDQRDSSGYSQQGSPRPQNRWSKSGPSAEDPNAYRAPGFSSNQNQPPPRRFTSKRNARDDQDNDLDEREGQVAMLGAYNAESTMDRQGLRTDPVQNQQQYPNRGQSQYRPRQGNYSGNSGYSGQQNSHGSSYSQRPYTPRPESQRQEHRPNSYQRPQSEWYPTKCANCGASASVPFEPAPHRPAYCKPCYQTRKAEFTHRS